MPFPHDDVAPQPDPPSSPHNVATSTSTSVSAWGQALGSVPHHPLPDTALLLNQERQLRVGLAREARAPCGMRIRAQPNPNVVRDTDPSIARRLARGLGFLLAVSVSPHPRCIAVPTARPTPAQVIRLHDNTYCRLQLRLHLCPPLDQRAPSCVISPTPRSSSTSSSASCLPTSHGRNTVRLAQCADRIGRARFSSGLVHSVSTHAAPPPAPPSLVHPHLHLQSQTAFSFVAASTPPSHAFRSYRPRSTTLAHAAAASLPTGPFSSAALPVRSMPRRPTRRRISTRVYAPMASSSSGLSFRRPRPPLRPRLGYERHLAASVAAHSRSAVVLIVTTFPSAYVSIFGHEYRSRPSLPNGHHPH
ncbi:hypothetical protein K438DRAFT_1991074 [Mycena galopus ATCC 62051]|nr:hypothetical protein K438DRAFT_1991074 [Mycena galopus ATCC 62051]